MTPVQRRSLPCRRDVLRGGAGDDFIYPSHGTTRVLAGPGKDSIWAFYGKGTIDCGTGNDTARIRENGAFKTRSCERIRTSASSVPSRTGTARSRARRWRRAWCATRGRRATSSRAAGRGG